MEEILVVFKNLEQENQALRESIIYLQTNQTSISLGAFQQQNPNQRSHGLAYLTSLMAHIQSFKVLLTKSV
jgi:Tfp pilus assembly protein PilN